MGTTVQHSLIPEGHIHKVVNWIFLTYAEMVAHPEVTALDLHKFAYVLEPSFKGYYAPVHIDIGSGEVTWDPIGAGGTPAVTSFLELTDTPSAYTGAAGYKVVVNAEGTGLEFVVDEGGTGTTNLSYTASPTNGIVVSSTGDDATIPLVSAENAGLMGPTQSVKLAGIAASATANSSDSYLRDRANHTGTQPASTISDLTEATQDIVGALLVAGTNVTITYDDVANTITISASGGGGGGADNTVAVATISSGTLNLSAVTAETVTVSLTSNISTIVLPTGTAGVRKDLLIRFKQDATGGRTVALSAFAWSGDGVPPTVATAANAVTYVSATNVANSGWDAFK